ncbi:hypothetical protein DIURU_001862 [Diutina rugosa]|uniref:Glutathione hydrolase n=1 Tax=Diutina rugosa TaxID=5481 RepID=A0A642USW6_DIURU|nr:uncharacterized protein DIURU_001862 [Diutina rugosa]KAA8904786.1 hypothetical protein DIURU_001862 [Diutina rugosa]
MASLSTKLARLSVIALLGILGICFVTVHRAGAPQPLAAAPKYKRHVRVLDPYAEVGVLLRKRADPLSDKVGQPSIHPDQNLLVTGKQAMVACDVPLCSTMGKEILQKGGNAADAAITVALCIGSVNSHSSGIGGGGFILSKHQDDVISINAREFAPAGASKYMFKDDPVQSTIGGLAVGVPGELKGLWNLYSWHGSGNLTWKQLFEPVIKLNREGWPCSALFASILETESEKAFPESPELMASWDFIYKGGANSTGNANRTLVKEGDLIKRPNYANTLEKIANSGSADIFYDPEGDLARSMAASAQKFGGVLEATDFGNYDATVEKPIHVTVDFPQGKRQVYASKGTSSGLAMLAGLKFFSKVFDHDDQDLFLHKLVESFKWLAAIRTRFGDTPANYTFNLVKNYTGDQWIEDVLKQKKYADNTTFPWENYGPDYDNAKSMGTSHFSVVDANNNSVGMTTTVNLLFGSLVYDNQTGIILNNQMDDFSTPDAANAFGLRPSVHNFIRPFKHPLSSTTPTIIVDEGGRPEMVIGCAGGSRIPTAILQVIAGVYFYNYTLLDAMAYPRLHHQLIPEEVMIENRTLFEDLYPGGIKSLEQRKNNISESGTLTAMNGIFWVDKDREYHGVSDYWRKLGRADGY